MFCRRCAAVLERGRHLRTPFRSRGLRARGLSRPKCAGMRRRRGGVARRLPVAAAGHGMVRARRPGDGEAEKDRQKAPYRAGPGIACSGSGARARRPAAAPAGGRDRAAAGTPAPRGAGRFPCPRRCRVAGSVLAARRAGGAGAGAAGGGELLPGAAGRLRVGRRDLRRGAGDPLPRRPAQHLVRPRRHQERGPLLAAGLLQLLAGAPAVGPAARRLPRRQHLPAPAQLPAAVAPAAAPAGARRGADRRRVRGAPAARGVGGLDHRAQGRAVGAVLPGRGAGVGALRGGAAGRQLPAGGGAVHGRAAEQVGGGDAAAGAAAVALVAAGRGEAAGSAAAGAAGGDRGGDHGGGPGVLPGAGGRWSWATRWPSGR